MNRPTERTAKAQERTIQALASLAHACQRTNHLAGMCRIAHGHCVACGNRTRRLPCHRLRAQVPWRNARTRHLAMTYPWKSAAPCGTCRPAPLLHPHVRPARVCLWLCALHISPLVWRCRTVCSPLDGRWRGSRPPRRQSGRQGQDRRHLRQHKEGTNRRNSMFHIDT